MIRKIDHIVITTANPKKCIAFYQKLGFIPKNTNERWELLAGDFKINVHTLNKELTPHAATVIPGSADICFEIEGNLSAFLKETKEKGLPILTEILHRHGVKGEMESFYLRDPDGNLLEFSSYNKIVF